MITWIHPDFPEHYRALGAAADAWIGTPFFPNSSSRGPKGGVSCHALAACVYRDAGFADIAIPDGATSHAEFSTSSLIEEFLDGRPEFVRLQDIDARIVQPGDLLGFRIRRIVHHLGIVVRPGVFIHAIQHLGTVYSSTADRTWQKRLSAVWRPVKP